MHKCRFPSLSQLLFSSPPSPDMTILWFVVWFYWFDMFLDPYVQCLPRTAVCTIVVLTCTYVQFSPRTAVCTIVVLTCTYVHFVQMRHVSRGWLCEILLFSHVFAWRTNNGYNAVLIMTTMMVIMMQTLLTTGTARTGTMMMMTTTMTTTATATMVAAMLRTSSGNHRQS